MFRNIALVGLLAVTACTAARQSTSPAAPGRQAAALCSPERARPTPDPAVRASIVRVLTDRGMGSGALLTGGGSKRFIVTNYHVIEGSQAVFVQLSSDRKARMVAEIVKVDRKNDLALLRVSSELANVRGLYVAKREVSLGQELAVLGFPYVAGSESELTFETGSVSAPRRSIAGQDYIQTNANINPGNSGGPVVDGCGAVVGIAAARHRQADRVGLLVPAARIRELIAAYQAPEQPVDRAVRARLDEFFRAVSYRRTSEASEAFSRSFLENEVEPRVVALASSAVDRIEALQKSFKKRGVKWEKLSEEQQIDAIQKTLPPIELLAMTTAIHLKRPDVDKHAVLREFEEAFVGDEFGDFQRYDVDRVKSIDDDTAECDVRVSLGGETSRYRMLLVREWGDWSVDRIALVR